MENQGKRKLSKEEDEVEEELNGTKEEEQEDEEIGKLVLGIMEGYSDSVIPPLSQFYKPLLESSIVAEEKCGSSSRKRARIKPAKEARDEYIDKERDRRVKMSESFALLESMVPGLLPKTTREKILHTTTEYIKYLEETKKMLEKLKESSRPMAATRRLILPCTTSNSSSSISVTVSGSVAFFGIQCPKRHGLVTQIFMVFHKHQAEVLAANLAVNQGHLTLTITAFVNGNESNTVEEIKKDILIL